ncbi:MAG: aminopeptidase [Bacillota bacterium]
MNRWQEIVDSENLRIESDYQFIISRINSIIDEQALRNNKFDDSFLNDYFTGICTKLLIFFNLERQTNENYYLSSSLDLLMQQNIQIYGDLMPGSYDKSYANPSYCTACFGDGIGQLLSYVYSEVYNCHSYALNHKRYKLYEYSKLIIDIYELISTSEVKYDILKSIIRSREEETLQRDSRVNLLERLDFDYKAINNIIFNSDLRDVRFLFKHPRCITDHEIRIAQFISSYPEEKLLELSKNIVSAYIRSFKRDNKKPSSRNTVYIIYAIGHEILAKYIIKNLEASGYRGRAHVNLLSTNINPQYNYDHKFDNSILVDEEYLDLLFHSQLNACTEYKDVLEGSSGNIVFRSFGERPFSPASKKENLKLDAAQTEAYNKYNIRINKVFSQYIRRDESTFTIIALPSPEIGDIYEDIFEEMMLINSMDNNQHESIQQKIIDVLDKAGHVHIKGCNGNLTDIRVSLFDLEDTAKHTNFFNCVADVNIPVGEVFTTPKLHGTNGMLHLEEIFLRGFNYKNLMLKFNNGYIEEYSCSNFQNDIDNKKYIEDNMLFPFTTLPMGEFAIGTNTKAYAMAMKYGIANLLPILVAEKMGPHFAIGDTCYKHEEDNPVYNMLDGKEVISRENEKTALRKSDPDNAYTYKHLDITIPYEKLELISAVSKDGSRTDIIRDGRFVLEGTEELNKPLA